MSITKIYENDPVHGSGSVMDRPIKVIGVTSDVDVVHAEGTTAAGELIPIPTQTTIKGEHKKLIAEGQGLPPGEVKAVDPENPNLSLIVKLEAMTPNDFVQESIDPAWAQLEADGVIDDSTLDPAPAIRSLDTMKAEAGAKLVEWTGEKYAEGYTHTDGKRYWIEERDMLQFTMAESGMNAIEKAGLPDEDQAFKGMDGWTSYSMADAWTFIALYYIYVQTVVRNQMLVNDQITNATNLTEINSALAIINKSI